ncbi:hypothetical protein NMY22_g911 [Coprinellus aureogranulatus]|nr:hypothetical protein NMY22_g911 [Coprinellus aureogranulatus]
MNFFDTYDIARTPTPQPSDESQPSLNEELNEVVGQLGRFWGGFKRQSQQVLEVARKDLGDVVLQAQKEIGKFTAVDEPQPEASTSTTPRSPTADPSEEAPSPEDAASAELPTHSRSDSSITSSLFSRLQSALPPTLISTVQSHIPESIKHASENIDIGQLGTNLKSEFQRVGGITRAQAEEYARKSEVLIREAVKEANEVLKDAVKIIPPETQDGQASESGMIWDGTDMWMLPTDTLSTSKGKQSVDTQTAVASRALALLHRLQSDPSIVQRDPEVEEGVKDEYRKWVQEEIKAKGGIESGEWSEKIAALLKEETAMYELYTGLVPSTLSKEDFWSRYLFRAHQIKAEEERRKALIQASVAESDEDFSWEDDEEESPSAPTSQASPEKEKPSTARSSTSESSRNLGVQDTGSQRVSSSDSFDVVSSANASVAGDTVKTASKKEESDEEEEEDSDEEDESDSDWE